MYRIELFDYSINFGTLPKITHDGKVLIISNPKISGLHMQKLLKNIQAREIYICTIDDGEEYKTMASVESILQSAFNHKLDRKSLFIAFGGGVIGDIVGFSAGIFMRGIPFIQIPTTLLSQVDSSIGGKVGINNNYGKNLIGLFNQPKEVFIDESFLKTLPSREFNSGFAEIIKMAVCFDKEFFLQLHKYDDKNLLDTIKMAVRIKAKIVKEDEKENGIRAALNYGHTFAHAIELETNYKKLLHGEAVSIGMVMANSLALKLNLISNEESQNIKNLLEAFNLPTTYKINNINNFKSLMLLDKKSQNNKIKFVLPKGIGSFALNDDVSDLILDEVLREFA
ncbi:MULTISPECIES: 3-dehydroquinate synthase [Helicobacter]|uniref:3-dehydroquinate synthase n=1 Tax=Helicobacter ibis TaxID=2962633 RepID=A0ABT4VCP4_9HELI|nr:MULTISPECIES: 3-dehydroquinate synthase [Helicobacter]MDA3966741.1 3-dehydroquinate synthase [Helicobacter sp. WB40]MDA3968477.1 3-dehydroquinate synthase [Helicobacter ibis]